MLSLPHADIVAEYWHLDDRRLRPTRRPVDVGEATLVRLGEVLGTITEAIGNGLFVPHPDEPDPWRWGVRCACCDPDGADTATLWSQWVRKQSDPAVAPYLLLLQDQGDDEAALGGEGSTPATAGPQLTLVEEDGA